LVKKQNQHHTLNDGFWGIVVDDVSSKMGLNKVKPLAKRFLASLTITPVASTTCRLFLNWIGSPLYEKSPWPNPRGADRGAHSLNDVVV